MDNSNILYIILKALFVYVTLCLICSFLKIKGIQMQSLQLFKHIMFTVSYLEVLILQKYSTGKFMGQMSGDGDTKRNYILSLCSRRHTT